MEFLSHSSAYELKWSAIFIIGQTAISTLLLSTAISKSKIKSVLSLCQQIPFIHISFHIFM